VKIKAVAVSGFQRFKAQMISLTAVEQYLNDLWKGDAHAVIAIPDKNKGEKLMLITTNQNASRSDMSSYARNHGISEL
jgi:acyl-[acyl-carrier-protein]-phospholipid O-acyltransferase / long-chain-fatty-acid--[acyl-carrier-protein] ligase